jgi:hypothetical protein
MATLLIAGCSKQSSSAGRPITVKTEHVSLVRCTLKAGHTADTNLVSGLQEAANVLSELYTNSARLYPGLTGHFRGIMHVEARGTIRLIMEHGSETSPPEAKGIINDYITATMAGNWNFPRLGDECFIDVDFQLGKSAPP